MVASGVRHPITLGGKTFDVSPLNDNAHESLDLWLRDQYYQRAAGIVEKFSDKALQEMALKVAYKEALSLTWMSGEGSKLISTIEGMARILWEGIRINHPEVTYEEIKECMRNPETIRTADRIFKTLNTRRVAPATDKGGAAKKSIAKRKRELSRRKKST